MHFPSIIHYLSRVAEFGLLSMQTAEGWEAVWNVRTFLLVKHLFRKQGIENILMCCHSGISTWELYLSQKHVTFLSLCMLSWGIKNTMCALHTLSYSLTQLLKLFLGARFSPRSASFDIKYSKVCDGQGHILKEKAVTLDSSNSIYSHTIASCSNNQNLLYWPRLKTTQDYFLTWELGYFINII